MRAIVVASAMVLARLAMAQPASIAVLPSDTQRAQLDDAGRATLDASIRATTVDSVVPLGFSVPGESRTRAAVEASRPSLTSTCDDACARAAAEKLSADYLVHGTTTQSEGEYTTFLELSDRAGRPLGTLEVSGPSLHELRGELSRLAPAFFARSLTPMSEGQPVPPPQPDTRPVLRFQPEDHRARYQVEVLTANATFACEDTVTWLEPCELRGVPAGPARIRVRGSAEYTEDVVIPPGSASFRLWHKPYDVLYVGLAGVGVGAALIVAPDVGGFPDAKGAPALRAAGGLIGFAAITLIATDLFDRHNGVRRAPDESAGSWIHFDGVKVSRTAGGAMFTARGRF